MEVREKKIKKSRGEKKTGGGCRQKKRKETRWGQELRGEKNI